MTASRWERIDDFTSLGEFSRFVRWIEQQVAAGAAEPRPVLVHYSGASSLSERWYLEVETGSTWRLVWPDGPFHGLFEQVDPASPTGLELP